jgi:hypothetical protein
MTIWSVFFFGTRTFVYKLKNNRKRVVSRNDANPSYGDNKRLVCVRGDQSHDHIKDIRKRVD